MQIARNLAGYSLGRADLLRRAMGKKKKEIMEEERQNFIYGLQNEAGEWVIPGALRLGLIEKDAGEIFDLMAKFAEYGFNKGHATAYAVISYQTAYLKAHYPQEFTAALLSTVMNSSDKVSFYIQEAKSLGIQVLPPDVQKSGVDFTIEGEGIRFGLGAVRNVGANVVEKIIEARQEGSFTSLYDFCIRVDSKVLNKRVLESLLRAGAFSSICGRAQGLLGLDRVLEMAQQRQKDRESGQISLFDFGDSVDEGVDLPEVPEFPEREVLNMEKEYLGLYLSGHPLSSVQDKLKTAISSDIMTCLEFEEDQRVILGGLVTGYRTTVTKKGEMMASFVLEDLTSTIEVLIFPRAFAQISGLSNDQIIVIEGKFNVREDEKKLFAEKIYDLEHLPVHKNTKNRGYLSTPPPRISKETHQEATPNQNESQSPSPRKLFLRFSQEGTPLLDQVLPVLKKYTGPYPVYFYFHENKKVIQSRQEFWVEDFEALIRDLGQILGQENVAWKVS